MPWEIKKNHPGCPSSRPFAVVKKNGGAKVACHPSEASAKKQMAALYANENSAEAARLLDEAQAEEDRGHAGR